jgi:alpha-tubulin suppressor-like RCC1 family protein
VKAVACGGHHVLILTPEDKVRAWGWNTFGQIGTGKPIGNEFIPSVIEFPDPEKIPIGIGCGWGFSFVIMDDQLMYLWGASGRGALPDSDRSAKPALFPFKVCLPSVKSAELWKKVFAWIFVGRADDRSSFSCLPIEVVFHMVKVEF